MKTKLLTRINVIQILMLVLSVTQYFSRSVSCGGQMGISSSSAFSC
jgi:hypothetical protein